MNFPSAAQSPATRALDVRQFQGKSLSPLLHLIGEFSAPCQGNLEFGRGARTLIVACDGWSPNQSLDAPRSPNVFPQIVAGKNPSNASVLVDAETGATLVELQANAVGDAPASAVRFAELAGDGSWIAANRQTPLPAATPSIVVLVGPDGGRISLPDTRAQLLAAARIDNSRIAVVYEAWINPNLQEFPRPHLAIVDLPTGQIALNKELAFPGAGKSSVEWAEFHADHFTLQYRIPNTSGPYAYLSDRPPLETGVTAYQFDGTVVATSLQDGPFGSTRTMHTPRGNILSDFPSVLGEPLLMRWERNDRRAAREYIGPAIASNRMRDLQRLRAPPEVWDAHHFDGGRYIALTKTIDVESFGFFTGEQPKPAQPTVLSLINADSGAYIGSITSNNFAVSADTRRIATMDDGRIRVWDLSRANDDH